MDRRPLLHLHVRSPRPTIDAVQGPAQLHPRRLGRRAVAHPLHRPQIGILAPHQGHAHDGPARILGVLAAHGGRRAGAGMAVVQQVQHRIDDPVQRPVVGRRQGLGPEPVARRAPVHSMQIRIVIAAPHLAPDRVEHPLVHPRPLAAGRGHDRRRRGLGVGQGRRPAAKRQAEQQEAEKPGGTFDGHAGHVTQDRSRPQVTNMRYSGIRAPSQPNTPPLSAGVSAAMTASSRSAE